MGKKAKWVVLRKCGQFCDMIIHVYNLNGRSKTFVLKANRHFAYKASAYNRAYQQNKNSRCCVNLTFSSGYITMIYTATLHGFLVATVT